MLYENTDEDNQLEYAKQEKFLGQIEGLISN